tara:strand:+ start:9453 stop:9824 length:372 start_codon:yes stop_codon:yes gene_type:complete
MTFLSNYVTVIFVVKILFVYFAIRAVVAKMVSRVNPSDAKLEERYKEKLYLKERFELLFKLLMSIFLILVFNPWYKQSVSLDFHMKLLLYLFGFVLLIDANWKVIIGDSSIDKYLKHTYTLFR